MRSPIIEFNNFSFKYRAQAKSTLKNINLTIYEGEKILIVGPSGSGKSTLANCLNGLVPFLYKGDIQGSLKINGKDTRDMSIFEISNMVGTVLQDPDSQFIGLTAAEDIAFKLENESVSQDEMKQKVLEISKKVGIDNNLESSPHRLSGGQKQRVTLAGVMIGNVGTLLFDEPLASLDPLTGKNAIQLIDDIKNDTKKTIIIIEHRLEDVLHCPVDRIIVVNNGEIVADLPPNEIVSSDILKESGIREPLYITALKYAGCEISKEISPENIKHINIDNFKERLSAWNDKEDNFVEKNNNEDILELKNIDFSYSSNKQILKDVSFKIKKGEMVSIIGRNGAGKSTISKLIAGFFKQNNGQILYKSQDISTLSIKERADKIGIVMQNPNQMICKNIVFDEVAFGLNVRGISKNELDERVSNALKICGLYQFRNWPVSQLSFGQKKRVTIASILVLNPEVIILDEPTAGQDFKHYTEIMEFLKRLNETGITIIMITHDMHLMLEYTDRAIVLSQGNKLADDTPANVLSNKKIIEEANLKETSLYELAIKSNLNNPTGFIQKFINFDRKVRKI